MNISQVALARLYGYALLLGAILAFLYDLIRITRVFLGVHYCRRTSKRLQEIRLPFIKPYGRRTERRALGIVVFFEDLFFCIVAAIAMILLFYQTNNGNIRIPAFFLAGAGFLIYRGTLGRTVMLFSEVISFCIEVCLRYITFFLTLPIRFLAQKLTKGIRCVARRVEHIHKRSMRCRCTEEAVARLQSDACGLLPESLPKNRCPKRGKIIAKGKKTIQPDASDAGSAGTSRRCVDRCVRQ